MHQTWSMWDQNPSSFSSISSMRKWNESLFGTFGSTRIVLAMTKSKQGNYSIHTVKPLVMLGLSWIIFHYWPNINEGLVTISSPSSALHIDGGVYSRAISISLMPPEQGIQNPFRKWCSSRSCCSLHVANKINKIWLKRCYDPVFSIRIPFFNLVRDDSFENKNQNLDASPCYLTGVEIKIESEQSGSFSSNKITTSS